MGHFFMKLAVDIYGSHRIIHLHHDIYRVKLAISFYQ